MTREEIKARLESLLLEEFEGLFWLMEEDEEEGAGPWRVLVGEPDGCLPFDLVGENLAQDIWKKFACYLRPVRSAAADILKIPYWQISMAIEPSYEGYTSAVLYHGESRRVLLEVACKPWNFFWPSKEELLEDACDEALKAAAAMEGHSSSVWRICEEDVQSVARDEIGRQLTPDELHQARKGIEAGLGECWYSYVQIAVSLAVEECAQGVKLR